MELKQKMELKRLEIDENILQTNDNKTSLKILILKMKPLFFCHFLDNFVKILIDKVNVE